MAYKQFMKWHYAVIPDHKHNTLTKLPVKIHLEREMIKNGAIYKMAAVYGVCHCMIVGHV